MMQSVYIERIMKKYVDRYYKKTKPIPQRLKMNAFAWIIYAIGTCAIGIYAIGRCFTIVFVISSRNLPPLRVPISIPSGQNQVILADSKGELA